jgi:Flp pilus assembly pilin Flp
MKTFLKNEQGQDLVEYSLLLVFIVLVAAVAVTSFGITVGSTYANAASRLP